MTYRESDVERAFMASVEQAGGTVLGSQVPLPVGRADVMGVLDCGSPFLAEIKIGEIDEKACAQLMGYYGQVRSMLDYHAGGISHWLRNGSYLVFWPVLVGASINERARRVVDGGDLVFVQYTRMGDRFEFEWHWVTPGYLAQVSHPDYRPPRAVALMMRHLAQAYAEDDPRHALTIEVEGGRAFADTFGLHDTLPIFQSGKPKSGGGR